MKIVLIEHLDYKTLHSEHIFESTVRAVRCFINSNYFLLLSVRRCVCVFVCVRVYACLPVFMWDVYDVSVNVPECLYCDSSALWWSNRWERETVYTAFVSLLKFLVHNAPLLCQLCHFTPHASQQAPKEVNKFEKSTFSLKWNSQTHSQTRCVLWQN